MKGKSMRYTISKSIIEKVITYLASKPYAEVVTLIGQIQSDLKEVKESDTIKQEK